MNDHAFDVVEVLVMLECLCDAFVVSMSGTGQGSLQSSYRPVPTDLLKETSFFAQVGDPWTIVVGEHLLAQDGIGDLGRVDQVHLEQTRLQVPLLWQVVLERFEQEGGRLLDHILGHEDIDDLARPSLCVRSKTRKARWGKDI